MNCLPTWNLGWWVQIPLKAWSPVYIYSFCVVLCVGGGLVTGWSPRLCIGLRNWKCGQDPTNSLLRAINNNNNNNNNRVGTRKSLWTSSVRTIQELPCSSNFQLITVFSTWWSNIRDCGSEKLKVYCIMVMLFWVLECWKFSNRWLVD
jgi:hypothetical protein